MKRHAHAHWKSKEQAASWIRSNIHSSNAKAKIKPPDHRRLIKHTRKNRAVENEKRHCKPVRRKSENAISTVTTNKQINKSHLKKRKKGTAHPLDSNQQPGRPTCAQPCAHSRTKCYARLQPTKIHTHDSNVLAVKGPRPVELCNVYGSASTLRGQCKSPNPALNGRLYLRKRLPPADRRPGLVRRSVCTYAKQKSC